MGSSTSQRSRARSLRSSGCVNEWVRASGVAQETPIRLVALIELKPIPETGEERLECGSVGVWNLEGREHTAEVGAMVAIVEQADVPAAAERVEKLEQRARSLGELKAAHPLGADMRRSAADHVAHVQLRHLISRQIRGFVALCVQLRRDALAIAPRPRRNPHENLRLFASAQPVVELRDDNAA